MANPKEQLKYRTKKSDKKKQKTPKAGKGASRKNYFDTYKATNRWLVNKEKKMKRHAKKALKKWKKKRDSQNKQHGAARRGKRILQKMEAARVQRKVWLDEINRRESLGQDIRASYEAAGLIKKNPDYKPENLFDYEHALAAYNISHAAKH